MEQWDQDYIDLEEPGYFRLHKDGLGELYSAPLTDSLIVGMTMIKMQRE